ERGRYLVEGPLGCFVCHGERDWNALGAPPLADRKGSGRVLEGVMINGVAAGGRRVPPNITPDPETGAGNWTDDMFARAIREGIGHDGRALAVMPWRRFRNLSDEDLASVISYVRSIPAIRNVLPERILTEEQSQRLNPEPLSQPVPEPDLSTPAKRGQYLVTLAGCAGCHTPRRGIEPITGLEFGGGNVFNGKLGEAASANITRDPSGISYYDESLFIQSIRSGRVKARKLSAFMPWVFFRNMTDEDLSGVFAYLRTLKPVHHLVDNTEPPAYCELCGHKHGFGERNQRDGPENP